MSEPSSWVQKIVAAVNETLIERQRRPIATYRLEFRPDRLTFRDAAELVPYLRELGISHVYASPYLATQSGATHGYAVVDYTRLNPALGSEDDYRALTQALRAHGMGQLLDFVPNHMSISPQENRWWNNVLENGPSSPYADYFDIDWRPVTEGLRNKILLPVLGGQYGQILEAGELRLEYRDGTFAVRYYKTVLPIDPRTFPAVLGHRREELKQSLPPDSEDLRELESIITAAEHLPARIATTPDQMAERQREKEVIKDRLRRLVQRSRAIADFVEQNVREINGTPGDPHSVDRLEELLGAQVYRLSHWRAASDEINYRRFFDINELAAVSTENQAVFEDAHRLVFELLVRGDVAGLRIDHIDGLFDPLEYLWRLQWGYLRALGRAAYERMMEQSPKAETPAGETPIPAWNDLEPLFLEAMWRQRGGLPPSKVFPAAAPPGPAPAEQASQTLKPGESPAGQRWAETVQTQPTLYVVVEKILSAEEPLPKDWPVAGTTGYDFLNFVNRLYVDPVGLGELLKAYQRFTQVRSDFRETVYASKVLILRVAMSSELTLLAHRLNRLSERHRWSRDFTLNSLRVALREILANFPVYRTYISAEQVPDRDRQFVHRAVGQAKRRNPAMDAGVFDFVRDVLFLKRPPELDPLGERERAFFIGRFQQVTSPVMAKGVEDTAFYRYYPLSSLNEVGGEPARGAVTLEEFFRENLERREQRPRSLLASTTHDTKRSEDVRARINILSEIPQIWRTEVNRWARLNRWHRRDTDGQTVPSRNDEYLFYQALVGVWPLEPPDDATFEPLVSRLQAYMEKASHEAKVHTSWINPSPEYDAALREFVAAVLDRQPKNRFLRDFLAFHERIVDWGLYTALSQAFLKFTSPGVPDIYQGQELWDFSLVDPDNRRPVDFDCRRKLLAQLQHDLDNGEESLRSMARKLAENPRDQRLKLFLTWRLLHFHQRQAELFDRGQYLPLEARGSRASHVCAFAWRLPAKDGQRETLAVAVAPRLLARLTPLPNDANRPAAPLGEAVWQDTCVEMGELRAASLTNLFTGRALAPDQGRLPLAAVLSDFPVALLTNAEVPSHS
jgi:(1->4)-alpha-D-glucan 1-alpha-D-glucosylmutase